MSTELVLSFPCLSLSRWCFHRETMAAWNVSQLHGPSPGLFLFPSLPHHSVSEWNGFQFNLLCFQIINILFCLEKAWFQCGHHGWCGEQTRGLYVVRDITAPLRHMWGFIKYWGWVNNQCTLHKTMKRSHQNCPCLLPFLKGNKNENKGILYIDPVLGLWA